MQEVGLNSMNTFSKQAIKGSLTHRHVHSSLKFVKTTHMFVTNCDHDKYYSTIAGI